MAEIEYQEALKEKLIIAGINELEEHGLSDFSLRRVAAYCGASCAAPYRHFKNKDEFILEIIRYINKNWELLLHQIESIFKNDLQQLITEICLSNIKFRIGNPAFESILTASNTGLNNEQISEKDKQAIYISNIVKEYFLSLGNNIDFAKQKAFSISSYVFGSVFIFSRTNDNEILEIARKQIKKELEK